MSLEDQLAKIREASAKRRPPETSPSCTRRPTRCVNPASSTAFRRSASFLPAFSLNNAQGVEIHSDDLLSQGPLVLTVFRGVW